jgi:hypothetical protein
VNSFFPGALGLDDFVARVEIALFNYYGFTAQNSIAFTNACRDEITKTLRDKIDQVFGEAFAINGLGGVITAGTVGFGAGIAHAPISLEDGREKYVFFSFPHIAIPHKDKPGVLGRFGRSQPSSACGALLAAQGEFAQGGIANTMQPGVHDALNPEYSILKSRLAARFRKEGTSDFKNLDIVELTKVAERALRDDLELLISKSVDTKKADYAVISGVQIHAWSKNYDDEHPNLEMVWPAKSYVVVKGERIDFDLASIPGLSPRQLLELANATAANAAAKDAAGAKA